MAFVASSKRVFAGLLQSTNSAGRFWHRLGRRGVATKPKTQSDDDVGSFEGRESSVGGDGGGGRGGGNEGKEVVSGQEERPHAWMDGFGITPHAHLTEEELRIMPTRPLVYQLPLYNHPNRMDILESLQPWQRYKLLAPYGLNYFGADVFSMRRLAAATRMLPRRRKCAVVVRASIRQQADVVVRHMRYSRKYRTRYFVPRKFSAHDEFNLCRVGDVVAIQCWLFHDQKWKGFTVVENYGNKLFPEGTERGEKLKELTHAVRVQPEVAKYVPSTREYHHRRKKLDGARIAATKPKKNRAVMRRRMRRRQNANRL